MNFDTELFRINDKYLRDMTKKALDEAPYYFWTKPSSSSGKYHLPDEHGEGGLVLHTKRTCAAAEVLITAWTETIDFNVVRSACILHDIGRYGFTRIPPYHSLKNHHVLGYKFIMEMDGYDQSMTDNSEWEHVAMCVRSHMGKWGEYPPVTGEAWIVHLADMVASQYRVEVV